MQGSPEQHQHIHTEIVDVKDLRLGKEQDKDSNELGDGYSTDHRGSHVSQGRVSPLNASRQGA